jgi:hypothetical protein
VIIYDHCEKLGTYRLDVFDYFYSSERPIFYQLEESSVLLHVYRFLREFAEEKDSDTAKIIINNILNTLDLNVEMGTLDGALLEKYEKRFAKYCAQKSKHWNRRHPSNPTVEEFVKPVTSPGDGEDQ